MKEVVRSRAVAKRSYAYYDVEDGGPWLFRCERCGQPCLLLACINWDDLVCSSCWRAAGRPVPSTTARTLTTPPEWPIVEEE